MSTAGALRSLPPLLRHDPALPNVTGSRNATVAVAQAAQPFVIAGLVHLSERTPILVVTATGSDAERVADDLGCFLSEVSGLDPATAERREAQGHAVGDVDGPVGLLPAWETLPFERVSPEVGTMGRRLALSWHLLSGAPGGPRVVVAPVRAILQRLAPWQAVNQPLTIVPGATLQAEEAIEHLVQAGYRREHQVEHRGELAVRGGIIDVFPSTADMPVRIDLWGDEVDRLTTFDVGDQRSVADLPRVVLFGCRELVPTDEVRQRATELIRTDPWGQSNWERLAEGEQFDGMESWLPWVHSEESILTDFLADDAQIVLLDPRRVRDRAAEVNSEEAALAESLALTWDVPRAARRR